MSTFAIVAAIIFCLLGLIWRRDSLINLVLKILMLGMAAWGGFLVLQNLGYIVRI
jgi:hypothetical protein